MDERDRRLPNVAKVFCKVVRELVNRDWLLPAAAPLVIKNGMSHLEKLFPNGVSDGRIVDFLVYQIYRYRDLIAVSGSRWNITWCFSDKAIEKFRNQFLVSGGKAGMLYYIDRWLDEGGLSRGMLEDLVCCQSKHRLARHIYIKSEDCTKRRFVGTEMGLMLCSKGTTGWTPQSPVCSSCSMADRCMRITQKKYPELVRLRKEMQNDRK